MIYIVSKFKAELHTKIVNYCKTEQEVTSVFTKHVSTVAWDVAAEPVLTVVQFAQDISMDNLFAVTFNIAELCCRAGVLEFVTVNTTDQIAVKSKLKLLHGMQVDIHDSEPIKCTPFIGNGVKKVIVYYWCTLFALNV